ncbi:MAG: 3-ketoacyl-ACP reductase [Candidatus Fimivivens sp.]
MKKIAIVTGARRGIGLGISKELGLAGYYVVLVAASADGQAALEEMSKLGLDCAYRQCNIANSQARAALIDSVCDQFGRLDILVNNAGVAPKVRLDILETTEESYDRVVNTNARSTFFMCQLAANRMIALHKAGKIEDYQPRIINISSMSAYTASTSRGEYCISKASISMTTLLFADRLAEYGIPVFEVRPGIIQTDMTSGVEGKYQKMIDEGLTPIKRLGTPKDVADCVMAACSGRLDFATGQVLNADGGFHIRRL